MRKTKRHPAYRFSSSHLTGFTPFQVRKWTRDVVTKLFEIHNVMDFFSCGGWGAERKAQYGSQHDLSYRAGPRRYKQLTQKEQE